MATVEHAPRRPSLVDAEFASELPDELWEARHTWLLRILAVHVPALTAVGVAYDAPLWHVLQEALILIALILAAKTVSSRRGRALLAATALLTCSALLVHFTHGLLEAHFHFFVAVTLLAFYEDRAVYSLAVVYVLLHHALLGAVLEDVVVFSHPDHPDVNAWTWAAVHAGFILLAGLSNMLLASVNERSRESATLEARSRAQAEATAAVLMESLAPAALPDLDGRAQVAAAYRPGEGPIGGDFYEVVDLGDGRIGIGVGDVAGHGAQAASRTSRLRHTLRAYAADGLEPCSVMDKLERALGRDGSATCAYLLLDPTAETVTISLAGHLPPVLTTPDGSVEVLGGGLSVPLAGLGVPHAQETRPFPAGSTLLLFTDGLVERRDESIDVGLRRLRDAVAEVGPEPETLVEQLPGRLLGDAGQSDDVAVVALRTVPLRDGGRLPQTHAAPTVGTNRLPR